MSRTPYIKKPYSIHTFLCTWTHDGKEQTYEYVYSGDLIDGIISCYKEVLWSSMPDFEITLKESREI